MRTDCKSGHSAAGRALGSFFVLVALLQPLSCSRHEQVKPLVPETEPVTTVLMPSRMNEAEPVRLLVMLHGFNQTEQQFNDIWDWGFFYQPNFILASIRAPFRAEEGYGWTAKGASYLDVPEAKRLERFAATAEQRIMAQLDTLSRRHNIDPDKVYITGASQGAAIAAYVFLKHPDVFAGLGLIVGNMDARISRMPAAGALEGMPVFLSVGEREGDQVVEAMEKTEQLFAEAGADVRFYLHPEGHVMTQPVIRAMQNQLGLSLSEAPEVECVEISPGRFDDEGHKEQTPPVEDEYDYEDE